MNFSNISNTTYPLMLESQKENSKIYIHKIVSLGDEVLDDRTFYQLCSHAKDYLDKRYLGILKFNLLPNDYKEKNDGTINSVYRYSRSLGGQYSCPFEGVYLKDFSDLKILSIDTFDMMEFDNISFKYPKIEGFELKQKYNDEQKTGEIIYFSQKNVLGAVPQSNQNSYIYPMLVIQKKDHQTLDYNIDKREYNHNLVKYKIWNEHFVDSGGDYSDNPYNNLDTTIEFNISDKETYLITTVNFIYNGIPEKPILDIISNSFTLKSQAIPIGNKNIKDSL